MNNRALRGDDALYTRITEKEKRIRFLEEKQRRLEDLLNQLKQEKIVLYARR